MKLKVKLERESRIVDLEGREPTEVTLAELKASVALLYSLENQEFHLSLNKRDTLVSDSQKLSDLGIVSGDLLHLIGPNLQPALVTNQERRPRPQPLNSYSSQVDPVDSANTLASNSSVSINDVSTSESLMITSSVEDVTKDTMDAVDAKRSRREVESCDVNRYLHEPLVIRESTGAQVPILLQQLYESADCSCSADALWVVLHALMLESGFSPEEDEELAVMPRKYNKGGYYSGCYKYYINQAVVKMCVMVGVTMGNSMTVHAYPKEGCDFKTNHLSLKTSNFITHLSQNTAETYRALDRLSRHFMDTVSLPLTNDIIRAAGYPERHGLLALPFVVKLKILSFLGPRALCQLGQTCWEFASVYKDKTLWRLLYIRDFGKPTDSSLNRSWFEIYKEQRIRRNCELEARRRIFHVDATDPPWGFPGGTGIFRPAMPFPRMLGGDYDLHPGLGAGLPDILHQRSQPVQFPQVPRPSSLFGGLLQGSGRGNITGSPFTNNFHQPFM